MRPWGLGASVGEEPGVQGAQHALRWLPDGSALAAVVNGSETGWDIGCARVSRLVLEALLGSLVRQRDPALEGLDRALQGAARALAAYQSSAGGDDELCAPGATLLIAHVSARHAQLAWLGAARAVLLRGGIVAAETRPHTLRALLEAQGGLPGGPVNIPAVCVRHLGPQGPEGAVERVCWALEPGDRVALLLEGPERPVGTELLVRRLGRGAAGPGVAALLEAMRAGGERWGGAVLLGVS
ncbi:MAG: hypothetical protein MUF64_00260 [Polyangiaceae bacterium]|nr:hypothetical protein [Polyangiaceae bacterium]